LGSNALIQIIILFLETTTQLEDKSSRRSFQFHSVAQIGNGKQQRITLNVDHNKRTEIVTITLNGPGMKTEEALTVDLKVLF